MAIMSEPRIVDLNAMQWQAHPTIDGVTTRIVETAASHGQADVLMAKVEPSGGIAWHVHERAAETVLVIEGQGVLLFSATSTLVSQRKLDLRTGCVVTIPAGFWHSVMNMGDVPLLLFGFHTPPTF
jgi:mannose-6-phosphate isomerase-like protein (cupin superfamily)